MSFVNTLQLTNITVEVNSSYGLLSTEKVNIIEIKDFFLI